MSTTEPIPPYTNGADEMRAVLIKFAGVPDTPDGYRNHSIVQALGQNGITDQADLMGLSRDMISHMRYADTTAAPTASGAAPVHTLSIAAKSMLLCIIAFHHSTCAKQGKYIRIRAIRKI